MEQAIIELDNTFLAEIKMLIKQARMSAYQSKLKFRNNYSKCNILSDKERENFFPNPLENVISFSNFEDIIFFL